MRTLFRIGVAVALAGCIAGCATPLATTPNAFVTAARAKIVAAERVKDAVTIGKSTRADVVAALGETLVISFDSGYEVWVYRVAQDRRAEFVVLFAPSGIVSKTRLRR